MMMAKFSLDVREDNVVLPDSVLFNSNAKWLYPEECHHQLVHRSHFGIGSEGCN